MLKNYTVQRVISEGYTNCGQWPLNYSKAIQKSPGFSQLSKREAAAMKEAIPAVVELYRQKGFVTEEELDELNIPTFNKEDGRSKPKDQRVLHQQRAVVMNAVAVTTAYHARKVNTAAENAAKEARKIAKLAAIEERNKNKEEKLAERLALRELRANQKIEKLAEQQRKKEDRELAKKRQREEKEAENARKAALTPDQKKAERKAKRARVAAHEVVEPTPAPVAQVGRGHRAKTAPKKFE